MKLLQAYSNAGKVRKSPFNHRGGPMKLVQACLSDWKVREYYFDFPGVL